MAETISLIEDMPDSSEIAIVLEDASDAYAALGANPEASLSEVEEMVDRIEEVTSVTLRDASSSVQSAVINARGALRNAREESVDQLDEFEKDKRNLTCQHFIDNPDDLTFALLADDVNDKIYIVMHTVLLSVWQ